jgi:threonine dehydrogenase-like Zn-dependent dehydrogenase
MTGIAESIYEKVIGHKPLQTKPISEDAELMNALVWYSKEDLRYEEVPKPLVADSREVLLRVTSSSFCGSKSEEVFGHELMGIIEDVGKDVKNLQRYQRVVVASDLACGTCECCKKGCSTVCDLIQKIEPRESTDTHIRLETLLEG